MVSPHTGSHNQYVELVRIETKAFNIYIQGKRFHPTVDTFGLHGDQDGKRAQARFRLSYPSMLEIKSVKLFSVDAEKLVEWQYGDVSDPIFYETQTYELVIEKKQDDVPVSFYHENVNIRQAIKPLGDR